MTDQRMESETAALLNESAHRMFNDFDESDIRAVQRGEWPDDNWRQVQEAGFPLALISEVDGGFGLPAVEALSLVRVGGYYAAPVPLAETMLANRVLREVGFDAAEGPATIASAANGSVFSLARSGGGWQISGRVAGVPWARHASVIVALAKHDGALSVVRLTQDIVTIEPGTSLSALPADLVAVDAQISDHDVRPAPARWTPETLKSAGAALRVAEMAGALVRVMEMTVDYANERIQFGRPIGKQQAVQQQLAVLAGQAAAGSSAADIASAALDSLDVTAIAVAKVRAGEAASIAAPIAHQVHGAIGFTEEHRLHFFTRRLWAWRDEFGSERYWSKIVGTEAIATGADDLWSFVVSVSERQAV